MMSAEDNAKLQTLWGNFQRYGMRVAVAPPLNYSQANQTQYITLDTAAMAAGFFFGQITGNTGTAYSWKQRIESAVGTWSDGPLSGTLNAYVAEPSTPVGATIATGTLVLMRPSPTTAGTYEIYPPPTAASSWFYAQITGNNAGSPLAYSWKDRVETSAGVWADGALTGTNNAYQAQPSTAVGYTVPTGTLVIMQASPTVAGKYEFVVPSLNVVGASSLVNINKLTFSNYYSVTLGANGEAQVTVPTVTGTATAYTPSLNNATWSDCYTTTLGASNPYGRLYTGTMYVSLANSGGTYCRIVWRVVDGGGTKIWPVGSSYVVGAYTTGSDEVSMPIGFSIGGSLTGYTIQAILEDGGSGFGSGSVNQVDIAGGRVL